MYKTFSLSWKYIKIKVERRTTVLSCFEVQMLTTFTDRLIKYKYKHKYMTNTTSLCTNTTGLSCKLLNLLVHLTAVRAIQTLQTTTKASFYFPYSRFVYFKVICINCALWLVLESFDISLVLIFCAFYVYYFCLFVF